MLLHEIYLFALAHLFALPVKLSERAFSAVRKHLTLVLGLLCSKSTVKPALVFSVNVSKKRELNSLENHQYVGHLQK